MRTVVVGYFESSEPIAGEIPQRVYLAHMVLYNCLRESGNSIDTHPAVLVQFCLQGELCENA